MTIRRRMGAWAVGVMVVAGAVGLAALLLWSRPASAQDEALKDAAEVAGASAKKLDPLLAAGEEMASAANTFLASLTPEQKSKATFEFKGETFFLPSPTSWPDEVIQEYDPVKIAAMILGDDDYARFTGLGGSAMFLQRIVERLFGAIVGESSASSVSWRSTARQ